MIEYGTVILSAATKDVCYRVQLIGLHRRPSSLERFSDTTECRQTHTNDVKALGLLDSTKLLLMSTVYWTLFPLFEGTV